MSIALAIREALRKFHEETGEVINGIRLDKKTFGHLVCETGGRSLAPTAACGGPTLILDGYCEVWCDDDD